MGRVADLIPKFEKRGVKPIALSCDGVDSHKGWIKDIQGYSGLSGDFPYPIIADEKRELAVKLGMIDPDEKDAAEVFPRLTLLRKLNNAHQSDLIGCAMASTPHP